MCELKYPNWHVNALYIIGDRVQYDGEIYKCIKNHTAQEARAPAYSKDLWKIEIMKELERTEEHDHE